MKKADLKNINIQFISLVRKGANNRTVIFKSAEGAEELAQVAIIKTDDEKQMVYGVVYAPDEVDAHGHSATAQEIELASQRFMKSLSLLNVDKGHSFKHEGAFVAENWIVRKDDPMFPTEAPGAWAVGIKIEDAELYKQAKDELPAISMAGSADIHPVAVVVTKSKEEEESFFTRLKQFFTKQKDEGVDMEKKDVQEMIEAAITKSAEGRAEPMTEEKLAAVLKTSVDEMLKPVVERLEKIEKSSPGSRQDEDDPSVEDVQKQIEMGKRIAKMAMGTLYKEDK